ncbi:MAG: dicarboxylate/amino acid:cation symporter [Clostridia bacterium]|nr:dicarboxylate/amino acid:cation symporter [Clostridia bacterium]
MINTYTLTNENIDIISEEFFAYLSEEEIDKRQKMEMRLSLEEVLLNFQAEFGEEKQVFVEKKKLFGKKILQVQLKGYEYNPFENEADGEKMILHNLFDQMDQAPHYSYSNGFNKVQISLPKKNDRVLLKLVLALVLGVAFSLILKTLVPTVAAGVCTYAVEPIFNVFVGILNAIAGPMIFISVMLGIYNIGDINTFSKIGKSLLLRILVYSTLVCGLCLVALKPFYEISSTGTSGSGIGQMIDLVIGMVPTNLFTPFSQGNTMQIIVISILMGVCFLILGDKVKTVQKFFDELNKIIRVIMEQINRFIPAFVFVSVAQMLMTDNSISFENPVLYVTLFVITYLVNTVFVLVAAWIEAGINPVRYLKDNFKNVFKGLTTGNSLVCYGEMYNVLYKWGVKEGIPEFGVPLSGVLYKTSFGVELVGWAIYFAIVCDITITPLWLFVALVMSVIMAIAVPPVAGGTLVCYAIFLAQLGIPAEMVVIPTLLTSITLFPEVAHCVLAHPGMVVATAKKRGMMEK